MPIVTDNYILSLTQDNRVLRVRCSQNDTSRQVNFTIYNNGTLFTIPSGLSVSVHGIKQNGNIFTKSCTYSGSVVTLVLGSQITNVAGISVAELVFTDSSGGKIGTSNFIFQVESDPLLRGTIDVTEETPTEYISDLVSMIEALSARVNNIITPAGEASLSEVVDARLSGYSGTTYQNIKARIDADFAALGNTKADKSDTYTKEEVDDAIDNVTITTDETLSVPGAAADAKKTGDAISEINGSLDTLEEDLKGVIDYDVVTPLNWLNLDAVTDGILKVNGETEESTTKYYTDYIPVKQGDVIRQYYNTNATYRDTICAYDINKTVLESAGSNTVSSGIYTVPNGVSYVRLTLATQYKSKGMVTINTVPTAYSSYFAPYIVYNRDLLTAETKRKVDGIPTDIVDVTVKGSNLIPVSENGVGAYVRSGNVINFYPSYTTFHYAIIKVKKNTRYFINYGPRWWILADEENNVIDGAQYFTPYLKRYIDTGDASVLYVTIENGLWNVGLIVSEGTTGMQGNVKQNSVLKPLNQLMFDGWYACALPKNSIRFTSGIPEKFYFKNILSLPEKNMVTLGVGGFSNQEEDGVVITPPAGTNAFNNYLFTVYDDNFSVVEQNVNGQFGNYYADNVNDCSVLLIGDSTIERDSGKIGQTLLDAFGERGKTVTLLGSRGNAPNLNEGRSGWSAADYVGNTTRGADSTQNPFYNPTSEKFDFSYYMTNQNYASVDFVVIQLGINDLYNAVLYDAKNRIDTLVNDITTMLTSIKEFNSSQKILLNLPTPCTAKTTGQYAMSTVFQKTIRAKFIYYNALMMVLSTGFAHVRCSNCHLILDPQTEIADLIHPTSAGLSKMGMEVLSQINAWQNA